MAQEPAAKKAKTENAVFKKHATCLVLDYGSQVGLLTSDWQCGGGAGSAGGRVATARALHSRSLRPPCCPECAMGPSRTAGNAGGPYACARRRRRRPLTAAALALALTAARCPAPLPSVHTTDCPPRA